MAQSRMFRRQFVRFLASSPLWAQAPSTASETVADALSIKDFEPLARKALPPAHWGYLSTGVDDDITLRVNRQAMDHLPAPRPSPVRSREPQPQHRTLR